MIKQPEQRTEAWFEARATRVTGSNCGAILGHSPWKTPQQQIDAALHDYVYGRTDWEPNEPMQYGLDYEDRTIEKSKPSVIGFQNLAYVDDGMKCHDSIPYISVSPDKLIVDKETGEIVSGLEVKTQFWRSNKTHEGWFPAAVEVPSYWCQCQLACEVYNVETWHFFVDAHGKWSQGEVIPRNREWFAESMPYFTHYHETLIARATALIEANGLPVKYTERMDLCKQRRAEAKALLTTDKLGL